MIIKVMFGHFASVPGPWERSGPKHAPWSIIDTVSQSAVLTEIWGGRRADEFDQCCRPS